MSIKKENARVLWKTNDDGVIEDLRVEEFILENDYTFRGPHYLYQQGYSKDFGNCNSHWKEWTLAVVLIEIFVKNNFKDSKVREKAFDELFKIEEFNVKMAKDYSRL